MQTFLPYADFAESARCLDNKRLGKQRVEVLQILRTLLGYSQGWRNHPAVKMWKGYEMSLADYGMIVCLQWMSRGFKDSCWTKINLIRSDVPGSFVLDSNPKPSWFGKRAFHQSHQSNLLRKDPIWYGKFGWDVTNDLPYVWP